MVASGPLTFVGYFDDEAATRAALTPDGRLRTGDLGRWVDGSLKIVGRTKEVILRGGLTLTPDELEYAFGEVAGIGEVVAIDLPDDRLGEQVCLVVTGGSAVPRGPIGRSR